MSEIPNAPDLRLSVLSENDPLLGVNPEGGSLAMFTPEQQTVIAERMDPWLPYRLRLESPGVSLQQQCNLNYAYLNEQGISLRQFATLLQTAQAVCRRGKPTGREDETSTLFLRSDGRTEKVGRTASGSKPNPLNATLAQSYENTFEVEAREGWIDSPVERALYYGELRRGFDDVEVEMAAVGLFGARTNTSSEPYGSCRAEEILTILRASEDGQSLIDQIGIGSGAPEEPIALVPEPRGPTPAEQRQAAEAEEARQRATNLSRLIRHLERNYPRRLNAPREVERIHIDDPAGGQMYATRIEVLREYVSNTAVPHNRGVAVTIARREGRPTVYRLESGRSNGYRERVDYYPSIQWEEGQTPIVMTAKDRRSVPLERFERITQGVSAQCEEKLAEWAGNRRRRIAYQILYAIGFEKRASKRR